METEHTETVVEKAVAYVKDMLGIAPSDKTPDVEAKPEYVDTPPEVTAENAMRLDPNAYTRKSVADLNLEHAPRALQEETIENHENIESAANEMRTDKELPAELRRLPRWTFAHALLVQAVKTGRKRDLTAASRQVRQALSNEGWLVDGQQPGR